MKKYKILKYILSLIMLIIVSFTIYQSSLVQEKESLLIGTWICDDTPEWKLEFDNNGKCFYRFEGEPTELYNYTIYNGFSDSGIEHTTLKLIDVNDSTNIREYGINNLTNESDNLVLEIVTPKVSYFYFTKQ